jgi:hypothetical protein
MMKALFKTRVAVAANRAGRGLLVVDAMTATEFDTVMRFAEIYYKDVCDHMAARLAKADAKHDDKKKGDWK